MKFVVECLRSEILDWNQTPFGAFEKTQIAKSHLGKVLSLDNGVLQWLLHNQEVFGSIRDLVFMLLQGLKRS